MPGGILKYHGRFNASRGMALLVAGELGGVGAIVWGFVSTQLLG